MIASGALVLSLVVGLATSDIVGDCDEAGGTAAYRSESHDLAFAKLRPCENEPTVSGATLYLLAYLYAIADVVDVEGEKQRSGRVYALTKRAAMKGDQFALLAFADIHDLGDEPMGVQENDDIAACLRAIADGDRHNASARVLTCLGEGN